MKPMKKNLLEIQHIDRSAWAPSREQFQQWLDAALSDYDQTSEVVIRIVDSDESARLNALYRHKSGPTNVLSFPCQPPEQVTIDLLGDLVICADILAKEAEQQHKKLEDHWAHIVIHGVLHLLGYDHEQDEEARRMEAKEIRILEKLNINNPYQEVIKT